jgi:transposase-like protein
MATRLEEVNREQLVVGYLNSGVSVAEIAARVDVGEKRMRAIIR